MGTVPNCTVFIIFAAYDKKQQHNSPQACPAEAFPSAHSALCITVFHAVHVTIPAFFRLFNHMVRIPFMETGRSDNAVLCGCHINAHHQQTPSVRVQQGAQRNGKAHPAVAHS